jgi:hypothetical protein
MKRPLLTLLCITCCLVTYSALADQGRIDLLQAGPLAFAPDGVLLIGDTRAATLYAVETNEAAAMQKQEINIENIDRKIASALGTSADNVLIHDLTVSPLSGNAYMSVSRGTGPDAAAVILRISADGAISELELNDVSYTKSTLPNAPAADSTDRRGGSNRILSITDIAYHADKVVVAGLSNEEFASTLRSLDYPFTEAGKGSSIQIYHGNHGGWETRAPVRTMTTVDIDGVPYVIAAYTCTPLVVIPLADLEDGAEVHGITVAELGAGNRPLDMFVYGEEGDQHIMMANSRLGTLKVTLEDITNQEAITSRVGGTAGQEYQSLGDLEGIVQLAQADNSALALISERDALNLKTIGLP